ncbi:hypothetical protein JD844_006073 [Phrynosoma platyrhinos]|uniref:Apolipoprotein A-IV n=1 Tax=Phrynosoma platyrhinos TaxID=52577 RepID=A0ABQ7TQ72_PHRPL|nr:hypothetical protein JD844_006073 [Phrynosoma platyrhinos]
MGLHFTAFQWNPPINTGPINGLYVALWPEDDHPCGQMQQLPQFSQDSEMLRMDLCIERKGLPSATLVSLPSKVHCFLTQLSCFTFQTELLDDEDEAHPEGKGTASSKEDEDIVEKIIDVLGDVADAAEHTLEEIGKQVLPVIKSFVKAVETAVGKHLDPVIEKVEPHLDQLLHNLVKKVHELDHKLEELLPQQLEVLDKHASPYIQKLAELDSKKEAATK